MLVVEEEVAAACWGAVAPVGWKEGEGEEGGSELVRSYAPHCGAEWVRKMGEGSRTLIGCCFAAGRSKPHPLAHDLTCEGGKEEIPSWGSETYKYSAGPRLNTGAGGGQGGHVEM